MRHASQCSGHRARACRLTGIRVPGCAVGWHPAHACTCGVPVLLRYQQSPLLKMNALNVDPPAGTRSAAAARGRSGDATVVRECGARVARQHANTMLHWGRTGVSLLLRGMLHACGFGACPHIHATWACPAPAPPGVWLRSRLHASACPLLTHGSAFQPLHHHYAPKAPLLHALHLTARLPLVPLVHHRDVLQGAYTHTRDHSFSPCIRP